jgi:hypothetical protein
MRGGGKTGSDVGTIKDGYNEGLVGGTSGAAENDKGGS